MLTASDCPAFRRTCARSKAARNMPNSSSNTINATVFAMPSKTVGTD
jgi:hypothetical protein